MEPIGSGWLWWENWVQQQQRWWASQQLFTVHEWPWLSLSPCESDDSLFSLSAWAQYGGSNECLVLVASQPPQSSQLWFGRGSNRASGQPHFFFKKWQLVSSFVPVFPPAPKHSAAQPIRLQHGCVAPPANPTCTKRHNLNARQNQRSRDWRELVQETATNTVLCLLVYRLFV